MRRAALVLAALAFVSLIVTYAASFSSSFSYVVSSTGSYTFPSYSNIFVYNISGSGTSAFPTYGSVYEYVSSVLGASAFPEYSSIYGYGVSTDASSFIVVNGSVIKDGEVYLSPQHEWFDCNYLYRDVFLMFLNGSSTQTIYLMFDENTTLYANMSEGSGVRVVIVGNSSVVKPSFSIDKKLVEAYIKVGIKPSSFGGTGDYVMIKVNGTWIDPISVETGTSGQIINGTFQLEPGKVWVIEAVGMHHTAAGWNDPTTVYIWDSKGNLLHSYTASSHTWDNSIYDGTNYFEYVNIDDYAVPENVLVSGYTYYIHIDVASLSPDFYYVDVYYGGSGWYNVTGVVGSTDATTLLGFTDVGSQSAPSSCFETQSTTTTWTWSPPPPPNINLTITSPGVMISSPGIYDPLAILSLFMFLAIFIAYNKIARTGQALAVSAAISLMIAMISQNPYLIVLYTLLFAVGVAMWKVLR